MPRTSPTSNLKSLSATVDAWVSQVEASGGETCVLTWPEFEALGKARTVIVENRDIFRDLGVLGYAGPVTIFHNEYWSSKPLKFRDYDSRL